MRPALGRWLFKISQDTSDGEQPDLEFRVVARSLTEAVTFAELKWGADNISEIHLYDSIGYAEDVGADEFFAPYTPAVASA